MGKEMLGANFHRLLPLWNRLSSSVLAVPNVPVSAMRGKKAARAAPMLALAPFKACSAAMMSGRCKSKSEGKPACTSRKRGICASFFVACFSAAGQSTVPPTSKCKPCNWVARACSSWVTSAVACRHSTSTCVSSNLEVAPSSTLRRNMRKDSARLAAVRCANARRSSSSRKPR